MRTRLFTVASALSLFVSALAAQRTPAPQLVTTNWVRTRLTDTSVVMIHVITDRSEYDAGHVPGSVPMPVTNFAIVSADSLRSELPTMEALHRTLAAAGVANGRTIVVIGQPVPAARFAFTLAVAGLEAKTAVLSGGVEAWREDRALPISTTADAPRAAGPLTLAPRPSLVATIADVQAAIAGTGSGPTKVLDARAVEFYSGASAGGMPRAGHVPTAGSVPLTSLTGLNGMLRDPQQVRGLIRAAGAAQGDGVITYCHIGMQASLLWLQSRLAGYQARVFDGSWQAWSRDASLPIEGQPRR